VALNCSFPKSQRLRKRADYLAVQRGGKTQHCRYFVVVSAHQAQERRSGRLGITVSKKVGNAVTRNRVKRAVREFARGAGASAQSTSALASATSALSPWLPANLDVVVIAKKAAATAPTRTLWAALESCRSRLQEESLPC
jgi:ribonuclease P protein component